jgi:CRP/FNR family transcriptional regulator, cyclic AMP receptor protein
LEGIPSAMADAASQGCGLQDRQRKFRRFPQALVPAVAAPAAAQQNRGMSAMLRLFIQSSVWGAQLAEAEVQRVLASAREAVVPKGACVVRAGGRADHWVGLMDGIVVQMVVSGDGEATVLTAAGAGAWFGEGTLMKQGRWGYDAIARKEAKVALVPASTFRWLMEVSLPFNQFIARLLNDRLMMI